MCAPYTQRRLPSPAPTLSSTLRSGFRKVKTLSLKQGLSVDMGQRGEVKKGKATKKKQNIHSVPDTSTLCIVVVVVVIVAVVV